MPDALPPAVAKFVADVSSYTEPLQRAIDATQKFGDRTDAAALKARELGLKAQEAGDKAAYSMQIAQEAADKLAKGEIQLADATRLANQAARDQEKAEIAAALALNAAAAAAKKNADAQNQGGDAAKKAFGDMSMLEKGMLGLSFATGSLEPVAAGLIAVLGGTASAAASAGIGLGIFAVVAKSAISNVSQATKAYALAQNETGKMQQATLKKYQSYYAALTPAQKELTNAINKEQTAWQNFVASNTAGVSKVLSQGFGLLPKIFKDMQVFLGPVEAALHNVITELGKGISSSGFQQFVHVMAANAGPSIEKIARAIGLLVAGIGHLLVAFAPFAQIVLKGLDQMAGGFDRWAAGLSKTAGFQEFMTMVKTQGPTMVSIVKNLATVVVQLIKDMSGSASNMIWLKFLPVITQLAAEFTKANPGLIKWALNIMLVATTLKTFVGWGKQAYTAIVPMIDVVKGVSAAFRGVALSEDAAAASTMAYTVTTKIAAAATKVWAAVQAVFNAVMDANPIVLVIAAIALLVAGVIYAYTHFKAFRDIVDTVGRVLKTGFLDALHVVETVVRAVVDFVKAHWKLLLAIITGGLGLIVDAVITHWGAVKHATEDIWNGIVTVVRTAAHYIWDILGPILTFIVGMWKVQWTVVKTVTETVWNAIGKVVSVAVDGIKKVLQWFEQLFSLFTKWWDGANQATHGEVGKIISFVASIPGKILSALGDLSTLLWNAGLAVIHGLLHGMMSAFNDVIHFVGGIAGKIGGFFGLSPAKEGPLSGGGSPFIRGQHIARDLAAGILAEQTTVSSAAHRLASSIGAISGVGTAGAVAAPFTGTAAAAGGGGLAGGPGGDLVIQVDGQRLFTILQAQLYRYNIRNSGVATGVFKPA